MTAPLQHIVDSPEIPESSPAPLSARLPPVDWRERDRAALKRIVAELKLKPGIGPVSSNDWHHDRQLAEQWR